MNSYLAKYSVFIVFLFLCISTIAQHTEKESNGRIFGYIIDRDSNLPLEFTNIVLFNSADSTQSAGTVSDKKGFFVLDNIKPGEYYLRISFIGYQINYVNNIVVKLNSITDLGKIFISSQSLNVNEVVVSGQRSPITYEIDKKVINVSENFSSISGTAIDILENIPSVTVDIEGNVSLRGSGNFTVLIDGRPSILDANEALQQIPASAIENIEIITNPSAKYDPQGTAGIINIIMKSNKNVGMSGIVDLNGGLKNKYGGELLADYKNSDFQINLAANYNNRQFSSTEKQNNWNTEGSNTSYFNSSGNSIRNGENFGLRSSISINLGNKQSLTLGGRYGDRSGGSNSNLDYTQWSTSNSIQENYLSLSDDSRGGTYGSVFTTYKKEYETKGHQITAQVFVSSRNSDEFNTNKLFSGSQIVDGKITTESGPETDVRSKLDYSLPLGSDSKFEAGYQGEIEISKEITGLSNWNIEKQNFITDPLFSNESHYDTKELAIYSLYSDKIENFGYQFGLRTEYTGRKIEVPRLEKQFTIDKWDYFPSFHFSYEFLLNHQLMASYTKRINRPRGWELEPFETWTDAYNIRIGNPSLSPEYIDSYELGYQTLIGSSVISIESYYRVTKNKIERIRSVYSENVTLQSVQNVGKDYSLGVELFFNFDPIKNWNVNLMANLYDYTIEGMIDEEVLDRSSFNWSFRYNNSIKFSEETQVQLNFMYNSPRILPQGKHEGHLSTNFAIKHEFFEGLFTATLQVRDVFGNAKHESLFESFDFYRYSYSERESPVVMLNLKLNLNNYKNNQREENIDEGEDNGEDIE